VSLFRGAYPLMAIRPRLVARQGAYWKDPLFLLVAAAAGEAAALLLVSIRMPARYCVSRSKLTVVSHARTTWWWAPCYHLCLPASYEIRLQVASHPRARRAPPCARL
jgi:hypothetical protein